MMKTWLALLLLMSVLPQHEFHISKTTIRYVAEREQVQVEMHIFLDDLELALEEAGSPKLYIGTITMTVFSKNLCNDASSK